MKNVIKSNYLFFESHSFNVEPWVLKFHGEDINYFWRPADLEKLGTAVCFPLLGFLPDGSYRYNGQEYAMGIHGFAQDRDFAVAEKSGSHITYELADDEGTYRQYPWHFSFRITYSLEEDLFKTTFQVENRDEKELYFSVGGHPRYTCPIAEGSAFEDYYIEFEKPEAVSNIVKSYGPISEIEKRFSPDGKRINLDYRMFAEGCFCFHPFNSQALYLKSDKNSRGLCIDLGGASHLQFWTRPGAPFLAIEPFFGSISSRPPEEIDKDWIHKPGILHIGSGKTYTRAYTARPLR